MRRNAAGPQGVVSFVVKSPSSPAVLANLPEFAIPPLFTVYCSLFTARRDRSPCHRVPASSSRSSAGAQCTGLHATPLQLGVFSQCTAAMSSVTSITPLGSSVTASHLPSGDQSYLLLDINSNNLFEGQLNLFANSSTDCPVCTSRTTNVSSRAGSVAQTAK